MADGENQNDILKIVKCDNSTNIWPVLSNFVRWCALALYATQLATKNLKFWNLKLTVITKTRCMLSSGDFDEILRAGAYFASDLNLIT